MRVTFLTIMPSPYSLDLYAAIEVDGRIVPRVLYLEMAAPGTYWGDVPLPDSAEILAGGWKNFAGGRIHWNPGAIEAIRRSRPDLVVVSGYSSLTSQLVMRWLNWKRIPWIFWGEIPGVRKLGRLSSYLRTLAQVPFLRRANAIAGMGARAVAEYRRLARPGCEVVNIPYHTDLSKFLELPLERGTGGVRILYCGQLIERKGVGVLIDAYAEVADELPELELVLLGEGPLRQALAERVPPRLRGRVDFAGFHPIDRLPSFFGSSDIFVLPSLHDGWGVVVNQALGAGLPIICSNAVGAAPDLVSPGQNGFIVPPGDPAALAGAIRSLAADPERRKAFGRNSRAAAHEWVPARGVDRWVDLVDRVLQGTVAGHAQSLNE